jgi:molecular chaperone GrpE
MTDTDKTKGKKETRGKKKTPEDHLVEQEKALTAELASCQERLADWEDKFLRLAADYDNFRKRSAREFQELMTRANEELIAELIPILDNFERALSTAGSSADSTSFHQGIEMIYQQMRALLERQGVKAIQALHEPFDPHLHEAVLVVEMDDRPPETVVEEIEKGYMLNDKVLRPSKVAVSK